MYGIVETYRRLPDDEILRLYGDIGSLTDEGRESLIAEMGRRGLTGEQLSARREEWKESQIEQAVEKLAQKREKETGRFIILAEFGIVIAVGIVFFAIADLIPLGSAEAEEAAGGLFAKVIGINLSWVFLNRVILHRDAAARTKNIVSTLIVAVVLNLVFLAILTFPLINARLHGGELTDEANRRTVVIKMLEDMVALQADYKGTGWSELRPELLSRESYLVDLEAQNNILQRGLATERSENLGANNACEQWALDELGPGVQAYTTAEDNLISFAKSTTELAAGNEPELQLLTIQVDSAAQRLSKFSADRQSHGCAK